MAKKEIAERYFEVRVFDKEDCLVEKVRYKAYPTEKVIRQVIETSGGRYCTIVDLFYVHTVNDEPFISLADIQIDEEKWLNYKIWNPNMKDNTPYESSIEYPYNRLGVISIIKTASYNGLLVSFDSANEKAARWANWYAWEYDCSPFDFSKEEKDVDEDLFY